MMIPMSRKSYVLGEIGGVECRQKWFDLRVIQIIQVSPCVVQCPCGDSVFSRSPCLIVQYPTADATSLLSFFISFTLYHPMSLLRLYPRCRNAPHILSFFNIPVHGHLSSIFLCMVILFLLLNGILFVILLLFCLVRCCDTRIDGYYINNWSMAYHCGERLPFIWRCHYSPLFFICFYSQCYKYVVIIYSLLQ